MQNLLYLLKPWDMCFVFMFLLSLANIYADFCSVFDYILAVWLLWLTTKVVANLYITSNSSLVPSNLWSNPVLYWTSYHIGLHVALRFRYAVQNMESVFFVNRTVSRQSPSPGPRLECFVVTVSIPPPILRPSYPF